MKARSIMKPINKTVNATNGYKTKSAAFVFLLFQMFGHKIPLNPGQQKITLDIIELLIASGLLHDLWRHRTKITELVQHLFKHKKLVS